MIRMARVWQRSIRSHSTALSCAHKWSVSAAERWPVKQLQQKKYHGSRRRQRHRDNQNPAQAWTSASSGTQQGIKSPPHAGRPVTKFTRHFSVSQERNGISPRICRQLELFRLCLGSSGSLSRSSGPALNAMACFFCWSTTVGHALVVY